MLPRKAISQALAIALAGAGLVALAPTVNAQAFDKCIAQCEGNPYCVRTCNDTPAPRRARLLLMPPPPPVPDEPPVVKNWVDDVFNPPTGGNGGGDGAR